MHLLRPRKISLVGCALTWLLLPTVGHAQAADVLVVGDPELASRIRGQIGDLDYRARFEAGGVHDAAEARAAGAQEAAVVFWTRDDGTLTLHVLEVASGRTLTRQLARSPDDTTGSAMLEAAALIVRGALRDIAAGVPLPTDGTAAPAEVADEAEPEPTVTEPSPAAAQVQLGLAWRAGIDGRSPAGLHEGGGWLALRWSRLRVGASAGASVPVTTTDALANVTLWGVRLAAVVGADVLANPEWGLVLGAELGASLWHRRTTSLSAEATAADDAWTASLLLAPTVTWEAFPAVFDGHLGLLVSAGADIVPQAPRFVYQRGADRIERGQLWPVQPWLRLAVVAQLE
ncbi:MAG: hypothetical protein AB8I08_03630 [Sandaracinaceae bacterium]